MTKEIVAMKPALEDSQPLEYEWNPLPALGQPGRLWPTTDFLQVNHAQHWDV